MFGRRGNTQKTIFHHSRLNNQYAFVAHTTKIHSWSRHWTGVCPLFSFYESLIFWKTFTDSIWIGAFGLKALLVVMAKMVVSETVMNKFFSSRCKPFVLLSVWITFCDRTPASRAVNSNYTDFKNRLL